MNPIVGNIIRTVLIAGGAYIVTHYHIDQATVDAAVNQLITIGGTVAAGASAIWGLIRAIKQHQANKSA